MAQQPLIRPAQIDNLPFLAEEKKSYWREGLAKLWSQHDQFPAGSQGRQAAEGKLRQASTRIMQELSNGQNQRNGGAGNARPGSGGGQPPRPPNQGNAMGQQAGGSQQAAMKPGNPSQPTSAQQTAPMSTQTKDMLRNITVHVPANTNDPNYKTKWFQRASNILSQREKAVQYGKSLTPKVQEYAANGQPLPPQIQQGYDRAKNAMHEMNRQWEAMKNENEAVGRRNQAQQGIQSQQPAQQQQRPSSSNAQGDVNQDSRMSQSPTQPQTGFQQQSQQAVNAGAPTQVKQQQQQPNFPQQTPQQTPQTATQQQPSQQNFQQPQQQQYPNQQRPQPNQQFSQQSQAPQQNSTAAPNNANQPRPQALSQQAAMAQAAASYAQGGNQQQQSQPAPNQHPYPAQPQIPNGMPFNQQPGSATQPTPNASFPPQQSLQPTQTNHNKFPINKTMMLNPANQQPVSAPPARPTLNNAGMLQQPGVTRQPPFTLEGEGDRVLSKRKLDELVRQVTGGGEDGFLSPEVEELALSYVDDFVDNVIGAACKLAKAKPSQTLDIKDFQIALERNYGIRIPGYSLDEVRAVKKFQPAAGWHSKMQAIQTAKTLGGVGKPDS